MIPIRRSCTNDKVDARNMCSHHGSCYHFLFLQGKPAVLHQFMVLYVLQIKFIKYIRTFKYDGFGNSVILHYDSVKNYNNHLCNVPDYILQLHLLLFLLQVVFQLVLLIMGLNAYLLQYNCVQHAPTVDMSILKQQTKKFIYGVISDIFQYFCFEFSEYSQKFIAHRIINRAFRVEPAKKFGRQISKFTH